MTESLALTKVIEWSEDDQCFIGHCPGIIGPCCHGNSREQVERELHEIVGEWLEIEWESTRIESQVIQTNTLPTFEFPPNVNETFDPSDAFNIDESFQERLSFQQSAFESLVHLSIEHERGLGFWETEYQLQDITSFWPESGVGMMQDRVNDLFHRTADVVKVDEARHTDQW